MHEVVILSSVACFSFKFSYLIYSMQKSHFNVCFSRDFSKSSLYFNVTSNHFWMAEFFGSLIITVAETSVCPDPPSRKPHGGSVEISLGLEYIISLTCFSFLSVQVITNYSYSATAFDLESATQFDKDNSQAISVLPLKERP